MVEVLRSPSFVLSDSEDGPDVSSRFMRLDLSSLKEDQRIQHEKSQKPQEERTAEQQAQRSNFQHQLNQWQWENGDISSGAATPKANFLEPRRAFSTTEQLSRAGTQPSFVSRSAASRPLSPIPSPREPHNNMTDSYFQTEGRSSAATVPVSLGYARQIAFLEGAAPPRDNVRTAFGKPILPGPQRSYSVMDYEPVPFTHQPGAALLLVHLPPELHYAIFDFLEPLDSTAFALTSKHFYIIHRQMHGKVSLATRRSGPNDMEWVWRNAGPFIFGGRNGGMAIKHNALAELSPRGQVYCRKCRTARCELRNHIRDFFPADTEYCEITQKYGALAQPGAKPVCCRSSPRHPHRCGRHTRQQRAVRLS